MSRQRQRLWQLTALEQRDQPAASIGQDFVGIVRGNEWNTTTTQTSIYPTNVQRYGQPGNQSLAGDWNGDGKTDIVTIRANSSGFLNWEIDTNGDQGADITMVYGLAGDKAFLGDWDGDGDSDPGVARKNPSRGSLDWYLDTTKQSYANPPVRYFGLVNDIPVVGDWTKQGLTQVGIVRPVGDALQWNLDTNRDIWPDVVRNYGLVSRGDTPITGDWNSDGYTDVGITYAAANEKWWLLDTDRDLFANITQRFGFASDIPIAGRWANLPVSEIAIAGTSDGQTTPISFGSIYAGSTAPTKTFTVTNSGTGILTLGAMSLPNGFSIVEGLASSLAPNQSDTFTIRLNTGGVGSFSGRVSIVNNDPNENPYDFAIAGTVLAVPKPEITVVGVTDGQGSAISFGSVVAGATAPTKTWTVRNDGNAPLSFSAIMAPSGYSITGTFPTTLQPGQSSSLTAQLNTTTAGTFTGAIAIVSNDSDEGTFDIPVVGTVVPAVAEIAVSAGRTLNGTQGTINFGLSSTSSSATQQLTIQNLGNAPLNLSWLQLPTQFTLTYRPTSIAPGGSATIQMTMSSTVGFKSGTLLIGSNDSNESLITLNLQGTVVAPPSYTSGYPSQGDSTGTFTVYGGGNWELLPPTGNVPFGTVAVLRSGGTVIPLGGTVSRVAFTSNAYVAKWTSSISVVGATVQNYASLPLGLI